MTQEDLAGRIGKTVESVSNLERGKVMPSLTTILMIADALGTPVSTLVDRPPDGSTVKRLSQESRLVATFRGLSDADAEMLLDIGRLFAERGRR